MIAAAQPVGPLPKYPTTVLQAHHGKLLTIDLPKRGHGLVWRIARPYNPLVLAEAADGFTQTTVWFLFDTGRGATTVVFALTRGETAHAYEARAYRVVVR
jgi:hypothetical protein